jgi:hypothetical protein
VVIERRAHNQRLWRQRAGEDVVETLTAIQAQEFNYAKWSVAQRSKHMTEEKFDEAYAQGAILRTHVMRPTWHFVSPRDIGWLLLLTGPRVHAVNAPYYRREGLDEAVFARAHKVFAKALKGGNHLTRPALHKLLEADGVKLSTFALSLVVMQAELEGLICSGVMQGKQQTYALIAERAPQAVKLTRDEALVELVKRYFSTRGPATLKDFAWWSGLTQADARRGTAEAGIDSEVVGGRTYWFTGGATTRVRKPRVDLVQIYDEMGMAYSESRDELATPGLPRQEAKYPHHILLDGRLIGHWRRTVKARTIAFDVQLFRRLDPDEQASLEAAQQSFTEFSKL